MKKGMCQCRWRSRDAFYWDLCYLYSVRHRVIFSIWINRFITRKNGFCWLVLDLSNVNGHFFIGSIKICNGFGVKKIFLFKNFSKSICFIFEISRKISKIQISRKKFLQNRKKLKNYSRQMMFSLFFGDNLDYLSGNW